MTIDDAHEALEIILRNTPPNPIKVITEDGTPSSVFPEEVNKIGKTMFLAGVISGWRVLGLITEEERNELNALYLTMFIDHHDNSGS